MQYARISQEMLPRVHGCSEEKLKYPVFSRSMAAKRGGKTGHILDIRGMGAFFGAHFFKKGILFACILYTDVVFYHF